jgi:long-chain-fatty-acid--CoA ligase ACSBG
MPEGLSHYKMWTWKQYYADCESFAKSLVKLGHKPYDVVNILGFNSPEWFIANNGAQLGACIAAGIYATNFPEACHYITNHSKAKLVCLEDNKQLKKYVGGKKACCALTHIAVWGEEPDEKMVEDLKAEGVTVMTFSELMEIGKDVPSADIRELSDSVTPGNCSSLIYTSGTTGPPKAVMVSHDNVTWATANLCDNYMELNHTDRVVSFLPLSHIAAQIMDIHAMLKIGGCTYFCQPDALKGTLTETTREVRPTVFFGVPRVWEKIAEKMQAIGKETTGIKKSISTWAKGCGAEKTARAQFGGDNGTGFGFGCANTIVLSKIKAVLGLDQCKGCFTAAAPISPEVIKYFGSLNIQLYEVFGQSECTGPHTISFYDEWRIGTCGRPMYGTESITQIESGELAYRGRHIFMGYMYDEENSKKTIDPDGYLWSGDVVEFDDNQKTTKNGCKEDMAGQSGFMKITGRTKELIITAGGENIPPVLIENELKKAMPAVSNVMVIGDKRKFLTFLVSLKTELNLDTGIPSDKLTGDALDTSKEIGSSATTLTDAAKDPKWKEYIDAGMKIANANTTSAAQKVQKYAWLPKDFCEADGDLTPTLKLKRSVVAKKYVDLIDSIYGESVE